MRAFALTAAIMVLSSPLGLCQEGAAASVLLEALASWTSSSIPSSTPLPPESTLPNDCSVASDDRRCSDSPAAGPPYCTVPEDCTAYCSGVLNTSVPGMACAALQSPTDLGDYGSVCLCYDGEHVADIVTEALVAVGEVACYVWDDAFELTEDVLKVVGKLPEAKAAGWAGKIMSVGTHVMAEGTKLGDCPNAFCPGLHFTVVDLDDLENELGVLNVC